MLIGDAAHATTPHLASGAGMAIEDGIVLVEEIGAQPDLAHALEARFDGAPLRTLPFGRREFRVKLGQIEMKRGSS